MAYQAPDVIKILLKDDVPPPPEKSTGFIRKGNAK